MRPHAPMLLALLLVACASAQAATPARRLFLPVGARNSTGLLATPYVVPTATVTPTLTNTPTPTPTPTPLPGTEVAAGHEADSFDAGFAPGHPSSYGVDLRVGGPDGQNETTYWQADGPATFSSLRSWAINLRNDQTVLAVRI